MKKVLEVGESPSDYWKKSINGFKDAERNPAEEIISGRTYVRQ